MNEKITIQDIINLIVEKHGFSKKETDLFVKTMFDLISETLSSEKYVKIKGLGIFKLTEVDKRESVDVNTGERIEIQGHSKITFTPETALKELINKPFSHFETVVLNEGVNLEETPEDVENQSNEETVEVTDEVLVETSIMNHEVIQESPEEVTTEETAENLQEEPVTEVEEEIPVVTEPDNKIMEKKEEKTSKGLILVTILLAIIVIAGLYWLLKPSASTDTSAVIEETITEEIIKDTLIVESKDTLQEETFEVGEQNSPIATKEERVASIADTTAYRIVGTRGTHTLQSGETLIKVAVKYFGAKNYWPYIARHNQNTIKDADNVPIGTILEIPELVKK